ncbi:MAG: hypothetical protein GWM88_05525 [Pseudomonadales bacterium]|nr:hypothetical protein [Pseudomonadales bacterium]NIX07495.1 hypothetical protein [Pseudomonadales bacterium]
MLLRASGQRENRDYDLTAVTHGERRSGVEHEDWLKPLTEGAIRGEWSALSQTLDAASQAIGREMAVDCLVVASAFNGITRVADATGIPLDENTEATTADMRAAVGLDAFAYVAKSARFE